METLSARISPRPSCSSSRNARQTRSRLRGTFRHPANWIPIRRALILAIGRLARGRLPDIIGIDLASERLVAADTFGHAADLLFRELLAGVILLAQDGLGLADEDGIEAAIERFNNVRRLAVDTGEEDAPAPVGLRAISAFPGPHHLAGLLLRAGGTLRDSALVRTPAPRGANAERWACGFAKRPPDGLMSGKITAAPSLRAISVVGNR